ncbi:MAG: hypothetical protein M3Z36_04505 [Acidobacteriota bacterium]|nr:hypothetical protein [Acidobacteriota bacterium]
MAGKARGFDAGGWFDTAVGERGDPKSVSHEHTFANDTGDREALESTLARLSEMVGRRLREYELFARTIQLKLRYSDFTTITRAHSMQRATQLDTDLFEQSRALFRQAWKPGAAVRLLGVHTSSFEVDEGQLDLLEDGRHERWKDALSAADRMRDKYGDAVLSLATGMKTRLQERVHENPAGLPGQTSK